MPVPPALSGLSTTAPKSSCKGTAIHVYGHSGETIFPTFQTKEGDNLVKVTAYVTDASLAPLYRETRDQMLDGYECASTLLVISALAHPDWVVEIEAVAAV